MRQVVYIEIRDSNGLRIKKIINRGKTPAILFAKYCERIAKIEKEVERKNQKIERIEIVNH